MHVDLLIQIAEEGEAIVMKEDDHFQEIEEMPRMLHHHLTMMMTQEVDADLTVDVNISFLGFWSNN